MPAAFAEYTARSGWMVDPDQVWVIPDVMTGIAEILQVATAPGDPVVVNPPIYPPFFSVVTDLGRTVVEVPLIRAAATGWDLDLAGLAAAFQAGARAYLLCSPHNPVGRVWAAEQLRQVAELAAAHDVLVLADEIHAPLTLPGVTHTPFTSLGGPATEHGVVLTSASKAWNTAGLRCAVAVSAGPGGRAVLDRLPAYGRHKAGILGATAAVAAFRDGGAWLTALVAHLDRNRWLAADLFAEHLPGVGYLPPEAGYLAWLDCTALGFGDNPAYVFLKRGRVALSPGPHFGREGTGFARLNLGTSRDLLTEAVHRMAATTAVPTAG